MTYPDCPFCSSKIDSKSSTLTRGVHFSTCNLCDIRLYSDGLPRSIAKHYYEAVRIFALNNENYRAHYLFNLDEIEITKVDSEVESILIFKGFPVKPNDPNFESKIKMLMVFKE